MKGLDDEGECAGFVNVANTILVMLITWMRFDVSGFGVWV